MRSVPSLLEILQKTLQRLEGSPELCGEDPRYVELRRWLLLTIDDLEERQPYEKPLTGTETR